MYVLCLADLSCLGDSKLLRTADMWRYDWLEKDSPPCGTAHPEEEGMHYDFSKVTAATPLVVEQTGFGSCISGVWTISALQ